MYGGAQGPNSFDCSGFTYYVVKNKLGKSIPRTSTEQSRYGTYVSKGNLRAGDLVFFDTVGFKQRKCISCWYIYRKWSIYTRIFNSKESSNIKFS